MTYADLAGLVGSLLSWCVADWDDGQIIKYMSVLLGHWLFNLTTHAELVGLIAVDWADA